MTGDRPPIEILRQRDGASVAPIRQPRRNCPKISRNPQECGKKDTASLPQCATGI
jgi:hypothetical protein